MSTRNSHASTFVWKLKLRNNDMAQMLQTVKCMYFPAISIPFSPKPSMDTNFMLPHWADIVLEKKIVEIMWNGDPSLPPSHWRTEGPVYGNDEHFILTYLDLTKPVSKMHGLLAAPDWIDITELGGFVVALIRDAQDAGEGTVTRHQEMSRGFGKSDEGLVAHDLGPRGELISAMTGWSGPKCLNGIRYHLADRRSSVRWGKCGQAPSVVISTGDATPSAVAVVTGSSDVPVSVGAVGVKLYLSSHRDHCNAFDARLIGLQMLVADV
ncbi:hypothetical protein GYMLUDRAFT_242464 [Collybiopsis luxurians FD-317 M1]|uniref:Uncharacterized protein n=1 Tax=Collybiopsis luxurians FD-317 M1 TaxID=944289 RepID=A0A0D0D165_9AGAR|nr:hypothetical protein GYMLUDRAFT_242464 [Collybiopsis luxurians FD-317 M1]